MCEHEGCSKKYPCFNKEGQTKGIYCVEHKLEGMVYVKHKSCIHEGCKIRASFNKEGETKGIYCVEHKLEGMVGVVHKSCIYEGCKIRPNFNKEGETKGIYCVEHKLDGMVDVVNKLCIHEGCKTRPTFNKEGETKGIYCSEHKLEGMVDIKNKKCSYSGCTTQPVFNKEGETKGIYCVEHKLEGMIDVKSRLCNSEWCSMRAREKYNYYCLNCCVQFCPDINVARNYKTKENEVVKCVKEAFPDYTWVHDKRIGGGCSRRRPDLLLDLGTHIIIVEVDENKHDDYDCSCENKRLMEISMDLGHRPVVFIRFNPDEYTNIEGKTIKSCWRTNKLGLMSVMKSKQTEWEERICSLKTQINYFIENVTTKTVEIIELFY